MCPIGCEGYGVCSAHEGILLSWDYAEIHLVVD
jgi:hypothetical protein